MTNFFLADNMIMWTAIGALAQGIASILAIITLLYSMTTFKKSFQTTHYTDLDSMYFELLKAAMEKPYLYNSIETLTKEQKIEYDIYAFMVWNFLETIYDSCKKDKVLCKTWYPIINVENMKHRVWFDDSNNKIRFKKVFLDFIQNDKFKQHSESM